VSTRSLKLNLADMKPVPVTTMDIAFGGFAMQLLPPMESIPDIPKKWLDLQRDWFYDGLKGTTFQPKPGIDTNEALRHLQCIQSSFAPKHEHKMAGVAYLASLWFEDFKRPEK
jgi:hypothetical protein